jgi:hypothetical protein
MDFRLSEETYFRMRSARRRWIAACRCSFEMFDLGRADAARMPLEWKRIDGR